MHYRLEQLSKGRNDACSYAGLIAQYHAELYDCERSRINQVFRQSAGTIRCLVATVAFGMGVDIPDIRFVIHWGESDSLVQYWQEVGRAGRDGVESTAILYHRGTQVSLCQTEVKEFNIKIQEGSCIRAYVLDKLKLPHMSPSPPIDNDQCHCKCCSCCQKACIACKKQDEDGPGN
jgi:superfamily II DNA/RNA helicase